VGSFSGFSSLHSICARARNNSSRSNHRPLHTVFGRVGGLPAFEKAEVTSPGCLDSLAKDVPKSRAGVKVGECEWLSADSFLQA
jgi:hypothetical protein